MSHVRIQRRLDSVLQEALSSDRDILQTSSESKAGSQEELDIPTPTNTNSRVQTGFVREKIIT